MKQLFYSNFHTRLLIVERAVDLPNCRGTRISFVFKPCDWQPLIFYLTSPSMALVQEFYLIIHAIGENSSFAVYLQGITFRVTQTLCLLSYPFSVYTAPSKETTMQCFTKNETSWPEQPLIVEITNFLLLRIDS